MPRSYVPGLAARPVSTEPKIKQTVRLASGALYQLLAPEVRDQTPVFGRAVIKKLVARRHE